MGQGQHADLHRLFDMDSSNVMAKTSDFSLKERVEAPCLLKCSVGQ